MGEKSWAAEGYRILSDVALRIGSLHWPVGLEPGGGLLLLRAPSLTGESLQVSFNTGSPAPELL